MHKCHCVLDKWGKPSVWQLSSPKNVEWLSMRRWCRPGPVAAVWLPWALHGLPACTPPPCIHTHYNAIFHSVIIPANFDCCVMEINGIHIFYIPSLRKITVYWVLMREGLSVRACIFCSTQMAVSFIGSNAGIFVCRQGLYDTYPLYYYTWLATFATYAGIKAIVD